MSRKARLSYKLQTVYDASRRHGYEPFGDICETVQAHYGTGGGNVPIILEQEVDLEKRKEEPIVFETNSYVNSDGGGITYTLKARDYKDAQSLCYRENEMEENLVVRRLTPLECERLQGYPDGWTDIGEWVDSNGKKHKDADGNRYKALGNSIALPFWEWMAERMIEYLKNEGAEEPTMASLFDGIGGFPLVYQRHGCKAVWASEIEEFPIAVTKLRFKEE